jgi:hypothetical protein
VLNIEQQARLLAELEIHRLYAAFAVAGTLGLRPAELLGLRVGALLLHGEAPALRRRGGQRHPAAEGLNSAMTPISTPNNQQNADRPQAHMQEFRVTVRSGGEATRCAPCATMAHERATASLSATALLPAGGRYAGAATCVHIGPPAACGRRAGAVICNLQSQWRHHERADGRTARADAAAAVG